MENLDLIDRYFENTLSPKEQIIFNDLLLNDLEFKNEFQFQKDLKKVIAAQQQEDLKSNLVDIEGRGTPNSRLMPIPKKWMIAASVVILMSFGTWGAKNLFFPSNESIYADHFEVSRNVIHPVVRGESIHTIEYRAFVAYEAGNYHKAINLFNSVKNPEEAYVDFYKGVSYLALDKPYEAIDLLLPISKMNMLQGKSAGFENKARWYLSLAYIHIGDDQSAKIELKELIKDPSSAYKKDEAHQILAHLD